VSKEIAEAYHKAGMPVTAGAPKGGKGLHTLRAHKAVINYLKKGVPRNEAWKRVIGGMGKNAVKKSHQRTTATD